MTDTLTQVLLSRGSERQTAWIETRGAKPHARVEIKEDGQFWDVLRVYDTVPRSTVEAVQMAGRTHRKATDI